MNKNRLLRLAELLEADAVQPNGIKFDLNVWAVPDGFDNLASDHGPYSERTKIIPVDCGTVACAMGLAAISGVFKDEGLTYTIESNGSLYPEYDNAQGFGAAAKFFEIRYSDATMLFSRDGYSEYMNMRGAVGERVVAAIIREFVATG